MGNANGGFPIREFGFNFKFFAHPFRDTNSKADSDTNSKTDGDTNSKANGDADPNSER